MQKHILHFFLLSLVLWSCASAPATRHIQSVDLPAQWHEAHLDSTDSQEAWWVSFYNDELGNLISRSLEGNFDLRVAAGRLDEAMGLAKIAGADLLPSAQVSGSAIRQRQNFVGLPIPGSEGGVVTSHSSTFSTSLDLSWELDLWGRIRSGKSAALADVSAAYADFEGAKLSLTGRVAQAWFSYLEARDQVELSRATVQSYQNTLDQVQERFRLGLRGSLDVRLARSNLESARAGLASREQLLGAATRQLEALLGQYPSGTYATDSEFPTMPLATPAGLPANLVSRRPDLAAAERRLAGAGLRVKQAKGALYPQIRLTASGGTTSTELKEVLNPDFSVWNLLGNLTAPIFQGGSIRGNIKASQSREYQAAHDFGSKILQAFSEVENALQSEQTLQDEVTFLEVAATEAIGAERVALEQYRSGLIDFITVLESQRLALNAQSQLLSAKRRRLSNRVDLHLALGGGFHMPSPDERTPDHQTSSLETRD